MYCTVTKTAMTSTSQPSLDAFWRDDFAPLQAAGKAVLEALREDEAAPDADLYKRIVSSGSGSHLYYPSLSAQAPGSAPVSESALTAAPSEAKSQPRITVPPTATMAHQRSVPLPPYLAKELRQTRMSSLMGLLPEAELTWMSVDEKLFIWSHASSSVATAGLHSAAAAPGMDSFCNFVIPSGQCVVSVGLVRPKKGRLRLEMIALLSILYSSICSLIMVLSLLTFIPNNNYNAMQVYLKTMLSGVCW